MIACPEDLQSVRSAWASVRLAQQKVQVNTFAGLDGGMSIGFADFAHSLVLVFAFAVLEDCLRKLQGQGAIGASGPSLDKLLKASKRTLPWTDYSRVKKGHDARTRVAHDLAILPRAETGEYLDAIEAELLAWGVLDESPDVSYSLVRGAASPLGDSAPQLVPQQRAEDLSS